MTRQTASEVSLVEDRLELTLEELSRSCRCSTQWLITLVHEGVLESLAGRAWRSGVSTDRPCAGLATHLMQDLEVNAAGAALALVLMDDIRELRHQLRFGEAAA